MRERKKPTWRLSDVRACIDAAPQRVWVRGEARKDADRLFGLDTMGVAEAIRGIDESMFDAPLELDDYPGDTADQYRVPMGPDCGDAYVKFFIDENNILRVLSFKLWS